MGVRIKLKYQIYRGRGQQVHVREKSSFSIAHDDVYTALLPRYHKNPIEKVYLRKWAHLVRGILYIYPENVVRNRIMSCNAKVVCNADLFTSPFDRIVIFSYQIPYISSLFQPQDSTFATYSDRLYMMHEILLRFLSINRTSAYMDAMKFHEFN